MTEAAEALTVVVTQTIERWLAEQGGGMVSGYALALDYYDSDGDQAWATAHADNQSPAHTLGLLRWHTLSVEHDIADYFGRDDDDD